MYDIDKYYEAYTLEEAKKYLTGNPDVKIIAGGTDILIRFHKGKLSSAHLMGIGRIEELKGVNKDEEGNIHIGPLTTYSMLEESSVIAENIPGIAEAAGSVGGPQIRNTATIGGNLCNGATSADNTPLLLCLNALLLIESSGGERLVPVNDFFLGPGRVVLKADEILTDIEIKKEDFTGYSGTFSKFAQREAMDISTLNCAVLVKIEDKRFADIRIAFGVASPIPLRCRNAEREACGLEVTRENIDKISRSVLGDINPRDSWRGSKAFRLQLAEVLTVRSLCRLTGLKE